jgi:uncharacterized protein (TIGR00251 family)
LPDRIVSVIVQPRASRNEIVELDDGSLRVRTTVAPADGKANAAVRKMLARYFDVSPSQVTLTQGRTSRRKRFRICVPV